MLLLGLLVVLCTPAWTMVDASNNVAEDGFLVGYGRLKCTCKPFAMNASKQEHLDSKIQHARHHHRYFYHDRQGRHHRASHRRQHDGSMVLETQ